MEPLTLPEVNIQGHKDTKEAKRTERHLRRTYTEIQISATQGIYLEMWRHGWQGCRMNDARDDGEGEVRGRNGIQIKSVTVYYFSGRVPDVALSGQKCSEIWRFMAAEE